MTVPAPWAPQPITVTGGTGGIVANRGAIEHLARVFGDGGAGLAFEQFQVSAQRRQLPQFAPAGPVSLDLAGLSSALGLLDDAIADLQRAADDTTDLAHKLRNAADGYPWGHTPVDVAIGDPLAAVLHTLQDKIPLLGPGTVQGHGSLPGGGDDRVAGWDPGAVDLAARLVPPALFADLSGVHDDGLGVAITTGTRAAPVPRSLPDLLTDLGEIDRTGTPGGITVRILDGPAGRRVIVDITGTRTFGGGGRNVADLTTNILALNGHDTAYEQGVFAALRHAGVRRGDQVMLVGHSQGGMVAVNAARDAHRTGEFAVTHVITAGSPVGRTVGRVPPSVRVLALENPRDLVPRLDSTPNPDRRNVTTVFSPHGDGSVNGNHAIDESYVPLARDAQGGGSRSVRDFLTSADGYLAATSAVAHDYRVERR